MTSGDRDLNQRDRGGVAHQGLFRENGQPVGRDGGLKRTPRSQPSARGWLVVAGSLAWEHTEVEISQGPGTQGTGEDRKIRRGGGVEPEVHGWVEGQF